MCHGIHVYHIPDQPRFYIDNQWKLTGAFCWVAGYLGGSLNQPQITITYLPDYVPIEFTNGFYFAKIDHFVDESFAEDIITTKT